MIINFANHISFAGGMMIQAGTGGVVTIVCILALSVPDIINFSVIPFQIIMVKKMYIFACLTKIKHRLPLL